MPKRPIKLLLKDVLLDRMHNYAPIASSAFSGSDVNVKIILTLFWFHRQPHNPGEPCTFTTSEIVAWFKDIFSDYIKGETPYGLRELIPLFTSPIRMAYYLKKHRSKLHLTVDDQSPNQAAVTLWRALRIHEYDAMVSETSDEMSFEEAQELFGDIVK